jgi:hypothetical protein
MHLPMHKYDKVSFERMGIKLKEFSLMNCFEGNISILDDFFTGRI